MHFAYPPRKASNPPPYLPPPSSSSPRSRFKLAGLGLRRSRRGVRVLALGAVALVTFLYLVSRAGSDTGSSGGSDYSSGTGGSGSSSSSSNSGRSGGDRVSSGAETGGIKPTGEPPVVLVTVLDEQRYSKGYIDAVRENRERYAERHGMLSPPLLSVLVGYIGNFF